MQIQITYRQIISLSLPLMATSLFNNVINLIGVAFMGRVGETELAAIGIAALVFILLTMIPYGFSVGFQIIIARRAAEQEYTSIGKIFNNNLVFMCAVGILLFLFLRFLAPIALEPFFSSQAIYDAGMSYLHYRSFEIFLACFAFTLIAFYTSIGDNKIIGISALVMLLVNIFFNYSLVFGENGFPEMGIEGAGLASLISSSTACLLNLGYLIFSKYRKQFGLFNFRKFEWLQVQSGLKLSGPIVLQHFLSTGTWAIFFLMIEKMGIEALAASNVAKEVYMILGVTTWGFANATNSLVSNLLGQGRHDEVFELVKKVIWVSLVFSFALCAAILIFPSYFVEIFTNDEKIIQEAIGPVRIAGVCLVMMAVSSILFRAVTGTGATRYSLLLEFITLIIYMVYVIILIPVLNVNLTIAWTSEFIYWLALAWLCWNYLKGGKWKTYKV
ncbi:MAG: MATE family efflux transporter [Fimbriimonadaceae bacterium]|nr:MATE family efflux transporter [Chitinophagales bacterium]